MINKIFIQSHQCERARKIGYILEQYKNANSNINWYLVKDSFLDAIEVIQCPYCKLILPTYSHLESEIEEVSLLISNKKLPVEEYSTKVDMVQDWIDSKNIIAYADKAGDNIQIRWDEKIGKEELINFYTEAEKKYKHVKIGVYFNKYVERKINNFPITVNFVEMDLEEYMLSITDEKRNIKIS